MRKKNIKQVVSKAIVALNNMGLIFQYVKALNGTSYEIALSNESDAVILKQHFDAMWFPIHYKLLNHVFFIIMLKKG